MTFRPRTDLQTYLTDVTNGMDMDNVTNFSTRPKILIAGNDSTDTGGAYASGTLDLQQEIYQRERKATVYRDERYVVSGTYKLVDQSSDTNAKQVLEEIDRVLETYSLDQTHEYKYEFTYTIIGADRGEIIADVVFVLKKYDVDVTA